MIIIYLSILISSCNGEEKKENKKEIKIDKKEVKSEKKKGDNNLEITYIEIEPIDIEIDEDAFSNHTDDKKKLFEKLNSIDKKIVNVKNGLCYIVINGEKKIYGRIKDGKKVGEWKIYNSKGNMILNINYNSGKCVKSEDAEDIDIGYCKNGKLDGIWFYQGGHASERNGIYENGEKIGEWCDYNGGDGGDFYYYINDEKVGYRNTLADKPMDITIYRNDRVENDTVINGELIDYDKNGNIESRNMEDE